MLTRKTVNFFPLPSCYHGARRLQTKQSHKRLPICQVAKLPSWTCKCYNVNIQILLKLHKTSVTRLTSVCNPHATNVAKQGFSKKNEFYISKTILATEWHIIHPIKFCAQTKQCICVVYHRLQLQTRGTWSTIIVQFWLLCVIYRSHGKLMSFCTILHLEYFCQLGSFPRNCNIWSSANVWAALTKWNMTFSNMQPQSPI